MPRPWLRRLTLPESRALVGELLRDRRQVTAEIQFFDRVGPRRATVEFWWTTVTLFLLVARCDLFGHRLKETGHAGPDSGWISVDCTRCGFHAGGGRLY